MIVAGASAYPRFLDFEAFREICDEVGAYHDGRYRAYRRAGGGRAVTPRRCRYADFVTTTTHKTLRGPRGGMVMCKEKYAADLDRTVMPGIQGGPLMHVIAAKAVAFKEALQPEFKEYQKRILENAKALAEALMKRGFKLVSGGTDTHLMLVSFVGREKLTGKKAERRWIRPGSRSTRTRCRLIRRSRL